MIGLLATFLLLLFLSALFGAKEAILYSLKGSSAFDWDEHRLFVLERLVIVAIFFTSASLSMVDRIILVIAWILCFSMPHNEMYYYTRAKIEFRRYVFGYQSTTSSAKVDLNKIERLLLLIAGLIVLIVYILLNIYKNAYI